jgi:hypothetical protein
MDAYSYWNMMKQNIVTMMQTSMEIKEFGIEITLQLPENDNFPLPSESMKK